MGNENVWSWVVTVVTEHRCPLGHSVLLEGGDLLTAALPRRPPPFPSCCSQLAMALGASQVLPRTCRRVMPSLSQTPPQPTWLHQHPTPSPSVHEGELLRHVSLKKSELRSTDFLRQSRAPQVSLCPLQPPGLRFGFQCVEGRARLREANQV